jgi:hypothetical protein
MWPNFLLLYYFALGPIQLANDSLPPSNVAVVNFVKLNLGKKVGRGECWDLANGALMKAGAIWDHKFKFGKIINPGSDIFPGDIVQFSGVKLKHHLNDQIVTETMLQHTAIIYSVIAPGIYEIAQQNTGGRSGKKVSLSRLTLQDKVKGTIVFFRPQP